MPNAARSTSEFVDDGSWDLEIPLDSPDRFPLRELAATIGIHNSNVRKMAYKLGVLVEKQWRFVADGKGRQLILVTDAKGISALRRWYAR